VNKKLQNCGAILMKMAVDEERTDGKSWSEVVRFGDTA